MAVGVATGCVTIAIGSLRKDHFWGHMGFSAIGVARSAFLFYDETKNPGSAFNRYVGRNKKEVSAITGFCSRLALFYDAIKNDQKLMAAASLIFLITDSAMFGNGRAEKKTLALRAAQSIQKSR